MIKQRFALFGLYRKELPGALQGAPTPNKNYSNQKREKLFCIDVTKNLALSV
jgi:hypothetical protein